MIDLTHATWRTSSRSGANGNCVEVAITPDVVAVRDTKDRTMPPQVHTHAEWSAFIAGVQAGQFDL